MSFGTGVLFDRLDETLSTKTSDLEKISGQHGEIEVDLRHEILVGQTRGNRRVDKYVSFHVVGSGDEPNKGPNKGLLNHAILKV